MARWWLTPFLLASLLIPVTAAAPYMQFGGDAARTGQSLDAGPELYDVAFALNLPGVSPHLATPIIVGDAVFALVTHEVTGGVYRIDLATAGLAQVVGFTAPGSSLASDGERLFVAGPDGITAYDVLSGAALWEWPFPTMRDETAEAEPTQTLCAPLAIDGADLFAACSVFTPDPLTSGPAGSESFLDGVPLQSFAVRLDAATGALGWRWDWLREHCPYGPATCFPVHGEAPVLTTIAVFEDHVYVAGPTRNVYGLRGGTGAFVGEYTEIAILSAVDRESGTLDWTYWALPLADTPTSMNYPIPAVVATSDLVYLMELRLHAIRVEDGAQAWLTDVSPPSGDRLESVSTDYRGAALALRGRTLYAAGAREIEGFDVSSSPPTPLWHASLGALDSDQMHGMVLTDRTLLAGSYQGHGIIWDTESGEQLLLEDFGGNNGIRYGIGSGVVALQGSEGSLTILGRTAASVQVVSEVPTRYPAVGEDLTVDMSGSGPGALGEPVEFRADWGDGSSSPWSEDAVLAHSYRRPGMTEARFYARNDAGQVASEVVTLDVGGTPPAQPTFLQQQFARENQDRTFFVIGLLITGVAALLGATRLRRRRSRLQNELDGLQRDFAERQNDPREAGAVLSARRQRARRLLTQGKLDAAEAGVIERRIDELGAAERLDTIEDRFGFLSVGMARALRGMLADGRIQRWEREHFIQALQNDKYLTPAQKSRVRQQVDAWFKQDASGQRV